MGFTRAEKEQWKKEYAEKRKEFLKNKKKTKNQKIIDAYQLKKTHDWNTVFVRTSQSGGRLQATTCKKCGVDISLFKIRPVACIEDKEDIED